MNTIIDWREPNGCLSATPTRVAVPSGAKPRPDLHGIVLQHGVHVATITRSKSGRSWRLRLQRFTTVDGLATGEIGVDDPGIDVTDIVDKPDALLTRVADLIPAETLADAVLAERVSIKRERGQGAS